MKFYKSIADHYDHIFPLQKAQIGFVKEICGSSQDLKLLDIGCGTGSLCIELAKHYKYVAGIDPDEDMLKKASLKAEEVKKKINFYPYGMLEIESSFQNGDFDAILCFGNTLVHLADENEITAFLDGSCKILSPGGHLLIQIINYDRIIDQGIQSLPTIENDQIKFVRNYNYEPANNKIAFETILHIKANGEKIRNIIKLFPIRRDALDALLKKAGFNEISYFGNFKGSRSDDESIPLVISAQK